MLKCACKWARERGDEAEVFEEVFGKNVVCVYNRNAVSMCVAEDSLTNHKKLLIMNNVWLKFV